MQLLYPSDPFDKKKPDEAYIEEFTAARDAGMPCSVFSFEDFELGEFKPRPALRMGDQVLYRGWMLPPDRYALLVKAIEDQGGTAVTSAEQYRKCHYLPEWYADCEDVTPKTVFLSAHEDFASALAHTGWSAYFVKDYVKSLSTGRGSVAQTPAEVREIVTLIERYRGQVEGGVCVREFEDLLPESEQRFFVLRGRAYSHDDVIPDVVRHVAQRISSPFFSVDIVARNDGELRLIELGDGQVSDRKKWPATAFIKILTQGAEVSEQDVSA